MEQKRDFKAAAFEAKVWKEELKVNSEAKARAKKGQNFKKNDQTESPQHGTLSNSFCRHALLAKTKHLMKK